MKDYDELVIAIEIAEQLDADVEMSLDDYRKTKKKMKLSERVNFLENTIYNIYNKLGEINK
jgi:hypothetical protein|tara:strand:+ start:19 stop:201 length:183 start_codon:yes stop_codon:yes gene_type:complete